MLNIYVLMCVSWLLLDKVNLIVILKFCKLKLVRESECIKWKIDFDGYNRNVFNERIDG